MILNYDSDIVNETRCYELQTKTSDLKLLLIL